MRRGSKSVARTAVRKDVPSADNIANVSIPIFPSVKDKISILQ